MVLKLKDVLGILIATLGGAAVSFGFYPARKPAYLDSIRLCGQSKG